MRLIGLAVILAPWTLSKRGIARYTDLCNPTTE
jgi:hypothetical protein